MGSSEADAEGATRNWYHVTFYVVVLAYVVNLLARTTAFDHSKAKLFPYIFGIPTALLLLAAIAFKLWPGTLTGLLPERSDERRLSEDEFRTDATGRSRWRDAAALVQVAAFPALTFLVGFRFSIPVFAFAATYYNRRRIAESVLVTVVVTAFWWGLFVQFLNVVFFEGVVW